MTDFTIRPATPSDCAEILRLIGELAVYEKLEHMAVGTEEALREQLFGPRPAAETLIAERDSRAVGFALYFTTFSTFLCRPGIYLEDLFVEPAHRGAGIGKALLRLLCELRVSLDARHVGTQLSQDGRLVPAAGADLEHVRPGPAGLARRPSLLGHGRDDVRLGDRLPLPDRQGIVSIRVVPLHE